MVDDILVLSARVRINKHCKTKLVKESHVIVWLLRGRLPGQHKLDKKRTHLKNLFLCLSCGDGVETTDTIWCFVSWLYIHGIKCVNGRNLMLLMTLIRLLDTLVMNHIVFATILKTLIIRKIR